MSETKKCSYCQTEIPKGASKCPQCRADLRSWLERHPILSIILVFFVAGIFINMFDGSSSNTSQSVSSPAPVTQSRETISIVYAKEVIKNSLKSPSTAEFSGVRAYELSNLKDVWAVNGYVDSQNSFGAMIRSQWEVQLDYRDGKGGTVKSILLDGKKLQ